VQPSRPLLFLVEEPLGGTSANFFLTANASPAQTIPPNDPPLDPANDPPRDSANNPPHGPANNPPGYPPQERYPEASAQSTYRSYLPTYSFRNVQMSRPPGPFSAEKPSDYMSFFDIRTAMYPVGSKHNVPVELERPIWWSESLTRGYWVWVPERLLQNGTLGLLGRPDNGPPVGTTPARKKRQRVPKRPKSGTTGSFERTELEYSVPRTVRNPSLAAERRCFCWISL
jgi:hypothetical protein